MDDTVFSVDTRHERAQALRDMHDKNRPPVLAIMAALQRMAADLHVTGTFDSMASPLTYPDAQRLFAER